jgi:hypothetical protein
MLSRKIRVLKLDEDHRIYVFPKRVVYKERVNGRLVTRFSGVDISHLLQSSIIDESMKKKISEKLKNLI